MEATPTGGGGYALLILLPGLGMVAAGAILLLRRATGCDRSSRSRSGGPLEGQEVEKLLTLDWLVVKLETERGVLLARFTEMPEGIDRLVDPGDVVTLGVPRVPAHSPDRLGRVLGPVTRRDGPQVVWNSPRGVEEGWEGSRSPAIGIGQPADFGKSRPIGDRAFDKLLIPGSRCPENRVVQRPGSHGTRRASHKASFGPRGA